jgi:uncharacterized membrane protein
VKVVAAVMGVLLSVRRPGAGLSPLATNDPSARGHPRQNFFWVTSPAMQEPAAVMEPGRLQAFSDGVFAIAVTLLILDVRVADEGGSLAQRLGHAWPSYAAYVISFIVIGTMWINHHRMFKALKAVDHTIIVANLALLLVISFIPFPTKLLGEHLTSGTFADERTAVLVYGATMIAVSIVFPALWWAIARDRTLLRPHITPVVAQTELRRNLVGFPTYVTVTAVAIVAPKASLAGFGALALFYLLPGGRSQG